MKWSMAIVSAMGLGAIDGVAMAQTDAEQAEVIDTRQSAIWVIGASGGMLDRDNGGSSPYGSVSVAAYEGQSYVRGSAMIYRSTMEREDMARPSTYYVGTIGVGGNYNNWLIDAYGSVGVQKYGNIDTPDGKSVPPSVGSSGYFAAGLRGGKLIKAAPHFYVTPLAEVQFVQSKSLRQRFDLGRPGEFEVSESAWTGSATLRVDYALGQQEEHLIGASIGHYESSNGLTVTESALGPSGSLRVRKTPDSWRQVSGMATVKAAKNIWIDTSVTRTMGAVAGDSTVWALGVRIVP